MRAADRALLSALVGLAVGLAPTAALGQETGSDVQMPSATELVSSASLGLVAPAAAPTPQAFLAVVQATVTQALADPGSESRARSQLGDLRTSILMKAGVLAFDGGRALSSVTDLEDAARPPVWASRPLVFANTSVLEAAARRSRRR